MVNTADIVQANKEHTLVSWNMQGTWNPIPIDHAEGVYIYDSNGKKYIDWSSQLVNVNIGHSHPHVVKAIQEQVAKLCYVEPGWATEPRGRLGTMLSEVTGLGKALFTNGGTDAVENAMKIARMYTGKQKIFTRYKSYHGATFASMTAGGDPRRIGNEPGVPWIVRMPDPYAYRNPIYRGISQEEGDSIIADLVEDMVLMEGPQTIAAIMVEGYSGSSGIMQPTAVYFNRLREICDQYGLLLISDEVMSGFGRTGEWFGIQHYPKAKADIMAMAKGITSGYVPLGATMISDQIARYFDDHVLQTGLTYSAHALATAAGVATMEVYHSEKLVERSRSMGKVLRAGLVDLSEKHPVIGDVRGDGLHQVIELVKSRETREPISEWNKPYSDTMKKAVVGLKANGMNTMTRWNMIFSCPPLNITEAQIQEGLAILDKVLTDLDSAYEG